MGEGLYFAAFTSNYTINIRNVPKSPQFSIESKYNEVEGIAIEQSQAPVKNSKSTRVTKLKQRKMSRFFFQKVILKFETVIK